MRIISSPSGHFQECLGSCNTSQNVAFPNHSTKFKSARPAEKIAQQFYTFFYSQNRLSHYHTTYSAQRTP